MAALVLIFAAAPPLVSAQGADPPPVTAGQQTTASDQAPPEIKYKGVSFVPGGFIEAAVIYRSANENADIASTFINVPYEGSSNAFLSEFRGSARQSRLSLLVAGKTGGLRLSGYYEFDFLGASPPSNEIESNSFNIRQRQLWAQVDATGGFSFVAGQTWSLVTLNRSGIAPRAEWIPLTIDGQYVVGYDWTRQWSARVTQKLHAGKIWLAASVENPETTLNAVNPPSGVLGFNTSSNATSPSSQIVVNNTPGANGVSTDLAPDIVGKLAFEPGRGHYEVKGLLRFFRDRIDGANHSTAGGGIGAGAVVPLSKTVDVVAQGIVGSGIGRYASGQMPDVTLAPDGTIEPLDAWHLLAGAEVRPVTALDLYAYFGREHTGQRAFLNAAGQGVGYGSPLNDNAACSVEFPAAGTACQAQAKDLAQIQAGFWYRFHKGPEGTLQAGVSYSGTRKDTWPGAGGASPQGRNHILMTSFRYVIP